MKFIELNKRGYAIVDLDSERVQADWYHVPTIRERTDAHSLVASLASASGSNHLVATASASVGTSLAEPALDPVE